MSEDFLYCEIAFPLPLDQLFTYLWKRKDSSCLRPQLGSRVYAPLGGQRKVMGWVVTLYKKPPHLPFQIKELTKVIDQQPLLNQELLALARWLASLYFCSLGEALKTMLPQGQREDQQLDSFLSSSLGKTMQHSLSQQQQQALILWQTCPTSLSFLFGVTGAGKTEVFLQAAQHILAQQRTVIYLVPEITLVYQVQQQLNKELIATVALLHSQLTLKQYLSQWRLVQDGKAQLVIGTRNAVFAPLKNLGLIIIDEEHDSGYKSQARPRFNARHIAMRRCREHKARLLCGGATPSLESWWAMKEGRMQTLRMAQHVLQQIPQIDIVDLSEHRHKVLAPSTIAAIEDCCLASAQSILFLNQKGYARALYCHKCQKHFVCPECGVKLIFYEKKGLICHYCHYSLSLPDTCPLCSSCDLSFIGVGTERLEKEVKRYFPNRSIARLDRDTSKKRGTHVLLLDDMQQGRIDILLGTEMVAKGLDFPKVELVVIVLAESGFSLADFRADERCFMQLMQISGRAGRSKKGRVIIQTYQPQHPLIQAVSQRKLEEFYQRELNNRQHFAFPPFGRIFRLIFSSSKEQEIQQETQYWSQLLAEKECWRLLGPAPCPVRKKGKQYRFHILLISTRFDQAHRQLQKMYQERRKSRCRIEIDVDPLSMS